MSEQTAMRARHATILKTAKTHLDNNDVGRYWQTIAEISTKYAKLAGSVATGETSGKGARERLQESRMRTTGMRYSKADMQRIAFEIATGDYEMRMNNLKEKGSAGVTLTDTNTYHQKVFKNEGLDPETYSLQPLIAKMGDKAGEIVDTDPNFIVENAKRSYIHPTELMRIYISDFGDSADAELQDMLGTDVITPQDDFDENDTERGFGPHSYADPDTPSDERADTSISLSPDAANLRDALMPTESDDYGVDALMRKPVDDLTETEVQALQNAAFDEQDTETRHRINDRLQDFYRLTYGDGPAQLDKTGKMIPPTPIRDVPASSSPVRNPSGEPVNDGLSRIAKVMAQAAQRDGGAKIAESLQAGLNIMGDRLKIDGVVGPKTRAAIKNTIAEDGSRKVAAAAALGRFKSFAKDAKISPREAGDLRAVVQSDIQPLLDNPSAPSDRHEAPRALQRGLNALNPMTKLKEDGDIGPKTTAAFQAALADADENAVTESIASSLGFRA